MLAGDDVALAFTRAYAESSAPIDPRALAWWDLAAALRPCGKMSGWGRSAQELAVFRERHRAFAERAARVLASGSC